MKKKLLILTLVAVMLLPLSGCIRSHNRDWNDLTPEEQEEVQQELQEVQDELRDALDDVRDALDDVTKSLQQIPSDDLEGEAI